VPILHVSFLPGAKQVCQEDSASLLIPKYGEGAERRAAVQSLGVAHLKKNLWWGQEFGE
jgi:hypothetical protein